MDSVSAGVFRSRQGISLWLSSVSFARLGGNAATVGEICHFFGSWNDSYLGMSSSINCLLVLRCREVCHQHRCEQFSACVCAEMKLAGMALVLPCREVPTLPAACEGGTNRWFVSVTGSLVGMDWGFLPGCVMGTAKLDRCFLGRVSHGPAFPLNCLWAVPERRAEVALLETNAENSSVLAFQNQLFSLDYF